MWHPQKRQSWVIWISIIAAFLVLDTPGPVASLFCLTGGALIVWKMQKPQADDDAEDEEETPISEDHVNAPAERYCGECGTLIAPTWKMCPRCGTKWIARGAGK